MFLEQLSNVVTLATLVGVITPPTIGLTLCYPFSKKACVKISDYIVRNCAPRIFNILHTYKHFKLAYSNENKDKLPEQFIVISNHQSLLDIPIYMTFFSNFDVRFVAKDTLGKMVPMVSPMLRSHEHCMVPRSGSPAKAMKVLDKFAHRCMETKRIPIIFPEGTRSKDGSLRSFYSAGFRRITDIMHLPVVACVVDDGYKVNDLLHVMENMHKINYKAKILKIYDAPQNKSDQISILEDSKNLMQAQLNTWRKI